MADHDGSAPPDPSAKPVQPVSGEAVTGWHRPPVIGYPGSVQAAANTPAPFLAGAAVTLISLLIPYGSQQDRQYERWAPATLMLLVLATGALLATIQFAVTARRYDVTPTQLLELEPEGANDSRIRARLMKEQQQYMESLLHHSDRARVAYHCGITLLLAAVAMLLIPTPGNPLATWLPAASAVGVLACEAVWIAEVTLGLSAALRRTYRRVRRGGGLLGWGVLAQVSKRCNRTDTQDQRVIIDEAAEPSRRR